MIPLNIIFLLLHLHVICETQIFRNISMATTGASIQNPFCIHVQMSASIFLT